ncbi:MAG: aminotransferase class I/II-fold pyridoxal phosphate-dependent enzyme [Thermodesulfobacteriota bacterium]
MKTDVLDGATRMTIPGESISLQKQNAPGADRKRSGSKRSRAAKLLRPMKEIAGQLLRGRWTRYNIFSGTNSWKEVRIALQGLLRTIPIVDGPAIAEYERQFARVAGTCYAFSFASGRMGLYVILEALGIGPGDEVILPAYTCVVVPNALIYRGARPVYVDIDPRTFNIDINKIEAQITPRTKAIIAQHTYGLVCDVEAISEIARRRGLTVIEDSAHALGIAHKGRNVGSLGDVAYFSTDHSKVISTSTGGMVTTDNAELASRVGRIQSQTPFLSEQAIRATLRTFILEYLLLDPRVCLVGSYLYAWLASRGKLAYFYDETDLVKPTAYPYPARLSNAQALIGLSQLAMLNENIAWRRNLARIYDGIIGAHRMDSGADLSDHAFLLYTFRVANQHAWVEHLSSALDSAIWFTSVCQGRDANLEEVGYEPGSCPSAEEATRHCMNLPTHPRVRRPKLLTKLLKQAVKSTDPELRILTSEGLAPDKRSLSGYVC